MVAEGTQCLQMTRAYLHKTTEEVNTSNLSVIVTDVAKRVVLSNYISVNELC